MLQVNKKQTFLNLCMRSGKTLKHTDSFIYQIIVIFFIELLRLKNSDIKYKQYHLADCDIHYLNHKKKVLFTFVTVDSFIA